MYNQNTGISMPYEGCEHYKRSAQLECPTCKLFYPCRFCHDAERYDKGDVKLPHQLDRNRVTRIKCMACLLEQPPSQTCIGCSTVLGKYFCGVCNLFDDVDKRQFHCNGCGICRTGGAENYTHCYGCNICLAKTMIGDHKCLKGAALGDCTVCLEPLFTSLKPCLHLKCGHFLHQVCKSQLPFTADQPFTRCPLCQASVEEPAELAHLWRALDQEIALTPMPMELRPSIKILCNDCLLSSQVKWHVIGNKCLSCGGYNTKKVSEVEEGGNSMGGGGEGGGGGENSLFAAPSAASRAAVAHLLSSITPPSTGLRRLHVLLTRALGGSLPSTGVHEASLGGIEDEIREEEEEEEEEGEEREGIMPPLSNNDLVEVIGGLISAGLSPEEIAEELRDYE